MAGSKKNTKKVSEIWRPVRPKMIKSMSLGAVSAVALIFSLVVIALILRQLILGHEFPTTLVVSLFVLISIHIFSSVKAADYSHFASYDLEEIIRKRIANKMTQLPMGVIVNEGTGTFTKILQDDVNNLHTYIADSPSVFIKAILTPLISLVILFYFNWKFTLIILVALVIFMIIIAFIMPKFKEIMGKYNLAKEKMNGVIVEFIQAMPIIKLFDNGSSSFKRYKEALDNYTEIMMEWNAKSSKAASYSGLVMNPFLTLVIVVWAGIFMFNYHALDFYVWILFLLLATNIVEAILPYMMIFSSLEQSKMAIRRIYEVEDYASLSVGEKPQQITKYDIEFNDVSFKYLDNNVLEQVNFQLPAKTLTAIVGSSGSGKSTLARLIPRFWDVTAGEIKIGGVDIKDVSTHELMNKISFVFQDNFLFNDTVENNICFGLPEVNQEAMINAAKQAQAHDFIMKLPNGYQTIVGERGSKISGGQKQRITIARAFLQNRPILILDEATAHSDPENEALLIQAINHLVKDKTVVMIAHRISTITHADQILVLQKGKLVEHGKHNDLLDNKGVYAQLWQAYRDAQNWQYHQ